MALSDCVQLLCRVLVYEVFCYKPNKLRPSIVLVEICFYIDTNVLLSNCYCVWY